MVTYRRNLIPGGTYFFTVTLVDRSSTLSVDRIDELREAFRTVRMKRPFEIDAIVMIGQLMVRLENKVSNPGFRKKTLNPGYDGQVIPKPERPQPLLCRHTYSKNIGRLWDSKQLFKI